MAAHVARWTPAVGRVGGRWGDGVGRERPYNAPLLSFGVMPDATADEPRDPDPDVAQAHDVVFYDGTCGLCHRWVTFVIRRDPAGQFRFAPLQGATFAERLDVDTRASLPDSVVLLEADGRLRVRSDAALAIFAGLGPGWRGLAAAGRIVPRFVRDGAYRSVAKARYHRLFARPAQACPLMPRELRARFLP